MRFSCAGQVRKLVLFTKFQPFSRHWLLPGLAAQEIEMKKYILLLMFISIFMSACTSIQVRPLDASHSITHICIKNNPKVIVPSFLSIVRNGFEDHGISSKVFDRVVPDNCQAVLTYTALQSWDFTPYLSHAELRLEDREGKQLAYAEYHLTGKGGFSLTKWASVESKMKPVIDKLLSGYR